MPDHEKCAACGTVLNPPAADSQVRLPCPQCGGTVRVIDASIELSSVLDFFLGFKQQRPGYKRPIAEGWTGRDFFHKEEKWVQKESLIDRVENRYLERVTDPATGNVIHECDERLDQHTGHGSAKTKRTG